METQGHRTVTGQYGLPEIDLLFGNAEVGIRQQHAQQEQTIRALDQLRQGLLPGHPHVRAPEVHRLSRQQALTHKGRDHRYAQLAAQQGNLLFQPVTADFHPHHEHRGSCLPQGFDDLIGAGVQRIGVTITGQRQYRHGVTGFEHLVSGHFDINRARFDNAVFQCPRDLRRRLCRIIQDHLIAGHFLVHLHLRMQLLGLVVHQ